MTVGGLENTVAVKMKDMNINIFGSSIFAKLFLVLIWTAIISNVISQDHSFDCTRSGALCNNDNATCAENGVCSCPEDFAGYDCMFNETGDMSEECENCQNEGVCIKQNEEDSCYCEQAYYGKSCSLKRVSHHCKHDSMIVNINPNMGGGTFEGKIYVMEHEDDPDCAFQPASDGEGLTQTLLYESCGGAKTEDMESGDTERSFEVLVRYSDLMMVATDEKYTFKCIVRKTGSELLSDEFLMSEEDARFDLESLDRGVVSEDLNPVSFQVQDGSGQPLSGPVNLGSKVTLLWQLEGGRLYEAFQLLQVRAKNGHAEDHPLYAELPLVQDGCTYPGAKPVMVSFDGNPTDSLKIVFKSFVLRHTKRLQISTLLKVCENQTECQPVKCTDEHLKSPESKEGETRKRRDVEDTTPSFVTTTSDGTRSQYREYDTTIYVTSPETSHVTTGYATPGHTTTGRVATGHVPTGQAGTVYYPNQVSRINNPYLAANPSGQYYGYRQVVYNNPESAYYHYNRAGSVKSDVPFYSDGALQSGWPSYCTKGLILLILTIAFGILFMICLCCCVYYCVKSHDRPPKSHP